MDPSKRVCKGMITEAEDSSLSIVNEDTGMREKYALRVSAEEFRNFEGRKIYYALFPQETEDLVLNCIN